MKPIKSERKIGILQILLSGFCFGFLGLFGKMAYARGVLPGELLSLRFLIGGGLMLLAQTILRPRALRLPIQDLRTSLALGVFGYAIFSSCFFRALQGLSVSLTVLLLYTYPLLVAAGAWILFGEKIARARWIALPLVMAGLLMLIWGDFKVLDKTALIFGFASAFFYSVYILLSSHRLRSVDPLVSATYIQLAAGVTLSFVYWRDPVRLKMVIGENWPLLLGVGVICSAAAMTLFLAGLKKLRNWETSVLSTSEPVTGILLAIVLLNESFGAWQIAGALAILAAFVIVAKPSRRPEQPS